MVLTSQDITTKSIVQDTQGNALQSSRRTTYDATIGKIINCGKEVNENEFTLKSRGVVWVVSSENFVVPPDVTGVATLRTSLAHDGIFALNVGVLDPEWTGPVATALVNFGKDDFEVKKGDAFFRVLFLEHAYTQGPPPSSTGPDEYIKSIKKKSRGFSDTFLNMSSLVSEVESKVLRLPKWGLYLALIAIGLSFTAMYAPIAYQIWTDRLGDRVALKALESKVQTLEEKLKDMEEKNQEKNVTAPPAQGARAR